MTKGKKEKKDNSSVVARNRKAFHEYHILERFDAGIVLTGTEIKSVRERRVSFADSYAKFENNELWLLNIHIAHYEQGNRYNHEIARKRKLLLTKVEIRKLIAKTRESHHTIVPLKMYFKKGWAKVEIGLAKGKQLHDKKRDLADKSSKRDMERAVKERY